MRAYIVSADALNLREQPSTEAAVLVRLVRGQAVARLDEVEWGAGWWRVFADTGGDMAFEGYCVARHLSSATAGSAPAPPAVSSAGPDPATIMLSRHFSLADLTISETAARRGIDNTPTGEVLENLKRTAGHLEDIQTRLGAIIAVSSAYRSPALNRVIGGSNSSDHTRGLAADFTCRAIGTPHEVCTRIEASGIGFDQLIHEFGRWVHIGFGPRMRRQSLTVFQGTGYKLGILTEAEARALS
jgi:hypothetical protein